MLILVTRFSKRYFEKIKLEENGFSFCPEPTTKIGLINEKFLKYQYVIKVDLMVKEKN